MFTKEQINILLNEDNEFGYQEVYKADGPGCFNTRLALKKEKNAWLHVIPAPLGHKKKQIIFCKPLEDALARLPFMLVLASALIKHYDVYLWPGRKSSMRTTRPVNTPEEFWEKIDTTETANEKMVKDLLGEQGLSADNYIILDSLNRIVIERWNKRFKHLDLFNKDDTRYLTSLAEGTLDLSEADLSDLNNLITLVKPYVVRKIKIYALDTQKIKQLIHAFPEVDTLEIIDATDFWIRNHLNQFSGFNIILNHIISGKNNITIPSNTNLKSLKIRNSSLTSLVCGTEVLIETLDVKKNERPINCDLTSSVKKLVFTGCWSVQLKLPQSNQVEYLKLINCVEMKESNILLFPNLKKLVFVESDPKFLTGFESRSEHSGCNSLPEQLQLEYFKYQPDKDAKTVAINLQEDHCLKKIVLVNVENYSSIKLPKHSFATKKEGGPETNKRRRASDIEAWGTNGDKFTDLDSALAHSSQIRYLNFKFVSKKNELKSILPSFENLETLIIPHLFQDIKITNKKLKKLDLGLYLTTTATFDFKELDCLKNSVSYIVKLI
jgi:hypothetical protein